MIQDPSIGVTQHETFRTAVAEASVLPFPALRDLATERWHQVTSILRGSELEILAIGPLAEAADLPWPSTRTNESLVSFLEAVSPDHLLNLKGLGKRKVRTLLAIILSLVELVDDEVHEAVGPGSGHSQRPILIPTDPIARVEMFWSRISEKIASSEIAAEEFGALARRWGFPWPTNSKVEYTLGDVVGMDSLSQFVTKSRGLGKKKKPSIATIIWRAWTEVEPDGPAGPPRSGSEVARAEFEALADNTDVLEIIQKCIDLAGLNDRESSILERRYGLMNATPMTLEEIGKVDLVTRERIRQVQQLAEKKIVDNQTSSGFLRLALDKELSDVLHYLEKHCGSPLLKIDGEWHRNLIPSHCFLIDVIHGNVRQLLDQLVADARIQKTSAGWWLGSRLSDDCAALAERVRERIIAENRPLSLSVLADERGVLIEQLADAVWSVGLRIEMGYVFEGRVMAPERRCLFALRVASETQRWLWPELDFYQAALAKNAIEAGSMRLLMRDAECIPGVAFDIPGPFVIINPCAAENSGFPTPLTSGPPEIDLEDGNEDEDPEAAENTWEQCQGIPSAATNPPFSETALS